MSLTARLTIAYLFFLPFQWALNPAPGVDLSLARLLAPCLLLVFLAEGLFRHRLWVPLGPGVFALSGLLVWVTLSLLWVDEFGFAYRKVLFLWSFLPLFAVLLSCLKEPRFLAAALKALGGGAALAAIVGIGQFLAQFIFGVETVFAFWIQSVLPIFLGTAFGAEVAAYPSLLVNLSGATILRASAFFPDPHMFSLFLGLSFPIAIFLALQAKRDEGSFLKRWFWPTAAGLILLADALTFSRGGYFGLVVGAVFAFGWQFRQSGTALLRQPLLLLGGLLVCAGVAVFTPVGDRLVSSFSLADSSNSERLRLFQEAFAHIAAEPFFGTGIGNYPLLVKPSAALREPIYAHNLFLDIAVETGLIGLGFFVLLLGSACVLALRTLRRARPGSSPPLAFFALCALVIFFAHSLFETGLFSVQVLPALLFVLALSSHKQPVV